MGRHGENRYSKLEKCLSVLCREKQLVKLSPEETSVNENVPNELLYTSNEISSQNGEVLAGSY